MTIHNLEIKNAYFTNNERTDIEVLLVAEESTEDNLVLIPYNIEAKAGDVDYEWLISKVDIDIIHENTFNTRRKEREDFEAAIKDIAAKEGLIFANLNQEEVFDSIIDTIQTEIDDESLFKFKLKVFDIEAVKDCKDRSVKAEIRKAKSIPEVIAAFSKI
jgi:hypothetical protein